MDLEELLRSSTPPKIGRMTEEDLHKLFWKYKSLLAEQERNEAFWAATNKNLRIAYEKLDQLAKELQETQEQLVRTERLAVLGQLAGGIGHELRNPLGAIKNAVYFLRMVLEAPEPDVRESLDILEKEIATSERIISSLLDFARPKSPIRQKVNVNEIIQEALSRTEIPDNVSVTSQPCEARQVILADPVQLCQVFMNLMLNAIQAMPQGGQLTTRCEVSDTGYVIVSLADTGVGMSKDDLVRLFEPLFTTKVKGIGLGLVVCKTFVEAHGGMIEVESEKGEGSTFKVRLPLKSE